MRSVVPVHSSRPSESDLAATFLLLPQPAVLAVLALLVASSSFTSHARCARHDSDSTAGGDASKQHHDEHHDKQDDARCARWLQARPAAQHRVRHRRWTRHPYIGHLPAPHVVPSQGLGTMFPRMAKEDQERAAAQGPPVFFTFMRSSRRTERLRAGVGAGAGKKTRTLSGWPGFGERHESAHHSLSTDGPGSARCALTRGHSTRGR